MIKTYPNTLDKAFCAQLIKKFERYKDKVPMALPGGSISMGLMLSTCKYFDKEDKEILDSVHGVVEKYYNDVSPVTFYGRYGDAGYFMQKYNKDCKDNLHNDVHGLQTCNRFLGVIFCLNSIKKGMEIEFPEQKAKIKLKQGDVLFFPPFWTHPHTVSGPNKDQYIITTYLKFPE